MTQRIPTVQPNAVGKTNGRFDSVTAKIGVVQALRDAGYSDQQIIEIVLNIAANGVPYEGNKAFRTELDLPRVTPAARAA
ncbi:hypothetical protein [Microvirga yunnanensis]|uniref:hypothetical protein n=1 Tax=Microvirga yunnanensis TaxID=2953740 RepID=UPI0021C7EFA1|nr:hypothetical protein [Microvirga sp. HBU65207]